ncbi:hypothetical protein [Mycobacterium sp. MUNTM1]
MINDGFEKTGGSDAPEAGDDSLLGTHRVIRVSELKELKRHSWMGLWVMKYQGDAVSKDDAKTLFDDQQSQPSDLALPSAANTANRYKRAARSRAELVRVCSTTRTEWQQSD